VRKPRHPRLLSLSARKVIARIYRAVIQPHFVMKVRGRRAAGRSDVADDIISANMLSDMDVESRKVSMTCRQAIAMVDDNQVSIRCLPLCVNHDSVSGGAHLSSIKCRNIQSEVQFGAAAKRIDAVTITTGNVPLHRPDGGDRTEYCGPFLNSLRDEFHLSFKLGRPVL
jgi:hypothetical protein